MRAKLLRRERRKIGGRDIKDGLATRRASLVHTVNGTCAGNEYARGKFGIRIKRERELDRMVMLTRKTRFAASDDRAAVRECGMLFSKLLERDKRDGGIVICKIIRHILDLGLDPREIRALFCHNVAFAGMLLPCRKLGAFTRSDRLDRLGDGNGILSCIEDALDASDRVRMTLTYAATPEGVILTLRKDGRCVKARDREESGIPTARYHCDMTRLFRRLVYAGKMLGCRSCR